MLAVTVEDQLGPNVPGFSNGMTLLFTVLSIKEARPNAQLSVVYRCPRYSTERQTKEVMFSKAQRLDFQDWPAYFPWVSSRWNSWALTGWPWKQATGFLFCELHGSLPPEKALTNKGR